VGTKLEDGNVLGKKVSFEKGCAEGRGGRFVSKRDKKTGA